MTSFSLPPWGAPDCGLDADLVLEKDLDFLRDFLSTFWKDGSSGMANSNPTLGSFADCSWDAAATGQPLVLSESQVDTTTLCGGCTS